MSRLYEYHGSIQYMTCCLPTWDELCKHWCSCPWAEFGWRKKEGIPILKRLHAWGGRGLMMPLINSTHAPVSLTVVFMYTAWIGYLWIFRVFHLTVYNEIFHWNIPLTKFSSFSVSRPLSVSFVCFLNIKTLL